MSDMAIQGQGVDSQQETWVYQAIVKLGHQCTFQYEMNGGQMTPGGFVIDFVVWTTPRPQPIEFDGPYWHEGMVGYKDRLQAGKLKELVGNSWNDLYRIDGKLIFTPDDVYNLLLDVIGVGPG